MKRDARLEEAAADYRRGLSFIDEAFAAARVDGDRVLPCGRGCSSCCAAVFDVQPADALLLELWFEKQDEKLRLEIRVRAAAILAEIALAARRLADEGESTLEGWNPREDGLSGLPSPTATRLASAVPLPCPVLGAEGECLAHDDRPSLCRLQGLPWRDPSTGTELPDFCRLEPAMAENRPQELDLARIDAVRAEAHEVIRIASGGAPARPRRSFVAAVLVSKELA